MTDIKETIERLPDAYDAGLLGGTHLRNSDWWHDYIRAELGHAHDHYVQQAEALITAFKELEGERDRLREAIASSNPYVDCATHLALSTQDIRNPDMTPSPETNEYHRATALAMAAELMAKHEQSEFDRMERELAEEALEPKP